MQVRNYVASYRRFINKDNHLKTLPTGLNKNTSILLISNRKNTMSRRHFYAVMFMLVMNVTEPCLAASLIGATAATSTATTYDWAVVTHPTQIEISASPAIINISIDQAAGNCSSGSLLVWNTSHHVSDAAGQAQNASAVESVVMTAIATGRSIAAYGVNSGCEVVFLYLK